METGDANGEVTEVALVQDGDGNGYSIDDKSMVIINVDPSVAATGIPTGDSSGQNVVHTVTSSGLDGMEQAEVTLYPSQANIGDGSTFVYTTDGTYSTAAFDGQAGGQAAAEVTTVSVTLPSHHDQSRDVASHTVHTPPTSAVAVGGSAISNVVTAVSMARGGDMSSSSIATSSALSGMTPIAPATAEHRHSSLSSVAITNAQIVTARACPATVQWLIENFETAEGISLPRSTLYHFYLRHCSANKLDAVNAASFGKLIRSVFLGLRTRRLGTRGNSKYHYYGIRIKPTSPLSELPVEDYNQQGQRTRYRTPTKNDPFLSQSFSSPSIATPSSTGKANPLRHDPHPAVAITQPTEQQQEQFQAFLSLSQPLPTLPELVLDDSPPPEGLTQDSAFEFATLYKEHCEEMVNVIRNFQFHLLEQHWKQFWSLSENGPASAENGEAADDTHRLPGPLLTALCQFQPVCVFVQTCDNLVYQCLVQILVPEVLRPIPSQLTQIIRNLSKNLETWLGGAMREIPEAMSDIKMVCVSALSQTLRRYTSLNHLAQAARAVLQNSGQVTQMLNDLVKVDFVSIQEQSAWVCQCNEETLQRVQGDFKTILQTQQPLEDWAGWMEKLVDEFLQLPQSSADYVKVARQFILKWSFYSSMVIRDLTLRSAGSFGSFHLIRLLFDEYMFFVVETRVSKALQQVPIAVLGEFVQLGRTFNALQEDASFSAAENTMAELAAGAVVTAAPHEQHVAVPLVTS